MSWLDDKPSKAHRDNVMRAAEPELAKHRALSGGRLWFLRWAGAAALGLVGIVMYRQVSVEKPSIDLAENDPEMLSEIAVLEDLEFWQNLETIERLEREGA
jgi:hypothetical protein